MRGAYRERPVDIGRARARYVRQRLADELKVARATSGMTQAQLAAAAGVSQSFISAVERGARTCSIEVACRLAAAVGHELSIRLFPADGVPLRDSGQLALAREIVGSAHGSWRAHLEMPIAANDRRAADVVLIGLDEVLHLEIERHLVDLQAQLRAATLKRNVLATRFEQAVRLILVVPDRRSARVVIRQLATLIERTMPVRSSAIRRGIKNGQPIGGDGVLFWPIPPQLGDGHRQK